MTEILIFSRDRACQLDALLRSLYANLMPVLPEPPLPMVLWKASDDEYGAAYETCIDAHRKRIDFFEEDDFFADVDLLLPEHGHVCFFTDDDVLHIPASIRTAEVLLEKDDVIAFSLRLGANTTRCYPLDRDQTIPSPVLSGVGTMEWQWAQAECDFGYPLSLDGHVMRASDVRDLLGDAPFANPNELEQRLAIGAGRLASRRPLLASYQVSVLTGIPANRVNQTHPNRFGIEHGVSARELNERYRGGERIDLEAMDFSNVVGAHQEIELVLS